MNDDLWVFGYGSLIWRPAIPFREKRPGYIVGFKRRFWQASTDHRGTPEAPGRVVTLLPEPGAVCWGMAYRVAGDDVEGVLAKLDYREKGGYERLYREVHFDGSLGGSLGSSPGSSLGRSLGRSPIRALLYVATADNPHYLGPTAIEEIARVVRSARGPSGANLEYVLRLAEALEAMGASDPHVVELARHAGDHLREDR